MPRGLQPFLVSRAEEREPRRRPHQQARQAAPKRPRPRRRALLLVTRTEEHVEDSRSAREDGIDGDGLLAHLMREAITRSSEPISDKTRTWKGGSGCGDSFRFHFVFVMPRRSTTVLAYLMRDAIMGHQRSL